MNRTYPSRLLMSRRLAFLPAALMAGALIAGCGTTSSTTSGRPGAAGAQSAPLPTVTSGSSSPFFHPKASHRSAGSGHAHAIDLVGHASQPALVSTPPGKLVSSGPQGAAGTGATSAQGATTGGSSPPTAGASGSSGSKSAASTASLVARIKTIIVHVPSKPIVKLVKVWPNVPVDAPMPSAHPALDLERFSVPGGNVGCELSGGVARCDVARKVWTPPAKPASCTLAWGEGLEVGEGPGPSFVCAGNSVLDPTGYVIPTGYDDHVGTVTCEVREVGVTCFDAANQGFFISRTGYTMF